MNIALRISNYISRYAPSEKKLFSYLEKKKFQGNIDILLEEIGYSESLMCDMWIRTFLSLSKWYREIERKLLVKWFGKDIVKEKLSLSLEEIQDWGNHRNSLEWQITTLQRKGKSNRIIAITLIGKYPYFRDEISLLLEDLDESDWMKKEIEKYLSKYDIHNPKEKMKFYQALARKGFSYKDVRNVLQEKDL